MGGGGGVGVFVHVIHKPALETADQKSKTLFL